MTKENPNAKFGAYYSNRNNYFLLAVAIASIIIAYL